MVSDILRTIVAMSVSSTLLMFLILLVNAIGRNRLSRRFQYMIWLLLIVRLLVPVGFSNDLTGRILHLLNPQNVTNDSYIQDTGGQKGNMASIQPDSSNQQIQSKDVESQADARSDMQTGIRANTHADALFGRMQDLLANQAFVTSVFWIWIAGMVVTACIKIVDYRNFIRYASASSQPITDSQILALFDDQLMELRVHSNVVLEQSRLISTPMLTGIVKPRILLPEHLPERMSDVGQLAYILQHELYHLKRSDILYKWVLQMVHCIHWFNPLLLLASHRINQLCELSCDEMLMASLNEEDRQQYGNVLLDMAEYGNGYKDRVLSMTLVEEKKDLKERLANIMNDRKHARFAVVASALVLVFVAAAALWFGTGNYQKTERTQNITASSDDNTSQELRVLSDNNTANNTTDHAVYETLATDPDKTKESIDASRVYNNDKLLAGDDCNFNFVSNYYSSNKGKLTIHKFSMTGSHTLLIVNAKKATNLTLNCSYEIQSGKFKLVSVDPNKKVTVIQKNTGNSVQIPVYPGRNVIKMAGQKCVVTNLKMECKGLNASAITKVYYSEMQEKADIMSAAVKQGKLVSFERFQDMVPFLDAKTVDQFIENTIEQKKYLTTDQLHELCPFASSKWLGKCLKILVQQQDSIEAGSLYEMAPFISSNDLGDALLSLMKVQKVDTAAIKDLAPFLGSDMIGVYLREYCDEADKNLDSFLVDIAPFATSDDLSACMVRAAKSKGLKQRTLSDLAPFGSSDGLYDYFNNRASLTQKDIDTIAKLNTTFMNRSDIETLYNKAKKQSNHLDLTALKAILRE